MLSTAVRAQVGGYALTTIVIEGNRELDRAAILAVSGLSLGGSHSPRDFDEARDRLLATGYFESVAYRSRMMPSTAKSSGGYDLTIEVKESPAVFPIRAEGLPVTAAQIAEALKAGDPLFRGKLPAAKSALDRAARVVESLSAGGPAVKAEVVETGTNRLEIEFRPSGGLPAVADLSFTGAKAIGAAELRNTTIQAAFGQPFSQAGFRMFLDRQVRPLYEAKGYMAVEFPLIATTPSDKVRGVDVAVTIEEGGPYQLSGIKVNGVAPGEIARILRMAGLPEMSTADFDSIREGAGRIREQLRHEGYLDAEAGVSHKNNDVAKTVEAIFDVQTGARYSFGKLTVNGLGLDGEAAVRKMWVVRTGEPYPAGYHDLFVSSVKREGLFDNLAGIKANAAIDRKAHVVDVTLEFTGTGKTPRR